MSELRFQLFSKTFPVAEELLYAACLALFLRPFMTERKRRWKLCLIFAAIC